MDSLNFIGDNKANDNESLLKSEKPTDVVLVAGGRKLHAHKKVLSDRSPVFAAMFSHSTKEAQESRVEIIDVDVEVLEMLLRYIYTGNVDHLDDNAAELLIAADKYQVDSLKSLCEEHLVSQISMKTVSDLFIFADTYQATDLGTECLHYIINNANRVKASKGWEKILGRADLIAKLCEGLLVKFFELRFSELQTSSSITAQSVSDLFIFADSHKVANLTSKCLDYITENGTRVMVTMGWKKMAVRGDLMAKIFEHLYKKYIRMFDE